jgi:hypothetical protein
MLKKFRSLFGQRTPIDLEVAVDPDPVSGEFLITEPGTSTDPPPGDEEVKDPGPALLADFRDDLSRQHDTQERIAQGITGVEEQLEPIARHLNRHMESIASSERNVAELVGEFTRSADEREQALQGAVTSLNTTGERQIQVLTLLQQQLDSSQQALHLLGDQFQQVGCGLETLAEVQRSTATRTNELVSAVRDQIDSSELAQQRTFRVSLALLGMGTIAILAAVVLVLVYA